MKRKEVKDNLLRAYPIEQTIEFSNNLKALRELKGWTQGELAEQLFVQVNTVSRWENGKGEHRRLPDLVFLVALMEIFELDSLDPLVLSWE
jgi:transcriptional regulator with XRE-family HTH domain